MESKIFTIDNGDKQFKAKLWLEERNVCFQVLEQSENLVGTGKVLMEVNPALINDNIFLRGYRVDKKLNIPVMPFKNNADRDAYFKKAYRWLQEFCDANTVVEKFDVYDVDKCWNYRDRASGLSSVFAQGMQKRNFAGIKYKGNEGWFMERKVMICDYQLSSCMAGHETDVIKQATPEKIRFFKETK